MILAMSRLSAPSAIRDRTSRSTDTVGSPASIFATRDWLEPRLFASSTCVSFFRDRRALRPSASFNRSSMYACSSAERPRKSGASPTSQPASVNFLRLLARIVVLLETSLAGLDDFIRRRRSFLAEDIADNDRVDICSVDNSPGRSIVGNPKFVAAPADSGHGTRVWKAQFIAPLKLPEQEAGFNSCRWSERRRFYFAAQPNQRLVFRAHAGQYMSVPTYSQPNSALQPTTRPCTRLAWATRAPGRL